MVGGGLAAEPSVAQLGAVAVGQWSRACEFAVRNDAAATLRVRVSPSSPDRWRCAPRELNLVPGAAGVFRCFLRASPQEAGAHFRDAFYFVGSPATAGAGPLQQVHEAAVYAQYSVNGANGTQPPPLPEPVTLRTGSEAAGEEPAQQSAQQFAQFERQAAALAAQAGHNRGLRF